MTEQKRNEIISRWRGRASIRQIARSLGMSRNTVSRVLAEIQARRAGDPDGSPSQRRPSRLDPYQPVILELLGRYPDLTAVRLLEELRQRGFTGCYSVVRQRLSELRPRRTDSRLSASRRAREPRPKWIMPSMISTSRARAGVA